MKNNHEIILKQYAAYCKEQPLYLGTAGSYGMEMLTIIREGVWAEYDILAAFHPPVGAAVQVRVGANNQIGVPIEATAEKGMGEIVFAGYKEGVRQIAVDVLYKVAPSSGASGTEPAEPTPDVVQQILSAASNAEEIAQSMQPAAAAATSAAAAATSAAAAATSAAAEATEAAAAATSAAAAATSAAAEATEAAEAAEGAENVNISATQTTTGADITVTNREGDQTTVHLVMNLPPSTLILRKILYGLCGHTTTIQRQIISSRIQ